MYSFIDLHNHSLCHVDDGAKNHKMMENMIDIAYEDGIKTICFTPHFKVYHFDNENDFKDYNSACLASFQDALQYVKEKNYDMSLLLSNEIMFHNDICENIVNGGCKKIGNSAFVLVEFSPFVSEFDLNGSLTKLLRKGYRPILAHFERYECILKKPSLLSELKNNGVILQANARSVLKPRFGKSRAIIKFALKNALIDIISTDAHDDKVLTPVLSKAHALVAKRYGKDYAKIIFHDNPKNILDNAFSIKETKWQILQMTRSRTRRKQK